LSPVRWSSPGYSRWSRGGSCTACCSVLSNPARVVLASAVAPTSRSGNSLQRPGSPAAAKAAAGPVSLWKNEGKNRWPRSVGGGLEALDTLYDSDLELTGFPLCLTPKI